MLVFLSPIETEALLKAAAEQIFNLEEGGALTVDDAIANNVHQRALEAFVCRMIGASAHSFSSPL